MTEAQKKKTPAKCAPKKKSEVNVKKTEVTQKAAEKASSEQKGKFNELIDTFWPEAKKDLQKGIDATKKMIEKSDKTVRDFSKKSIEAVSKNVTKEKINEVAHKTWPVVKKDLEIGLDASMKMLEKGDKAVQELSKKSTQHTKKFSLYLKREKHYHNLGKIVAHTPKSQWSKEEKIKGSLSDIHDMTKEMKQIEEKIKQLAKESKKNEVKKKKS